MKQCNYTDVILWGGLINLPGGGGGGGARVYPTGTGILVRQLNCKGLMQTRDIRQICWNTFVLPFFFVHFFIGLPTRSVCRAVYTCISCRHILIFKNSVSRILQCWSYYVKTLARHRKNPKRRRIVAIDSCFAIIVAHQYGVTNREVREALVKNNPHTPI